MKYLVFTLVVAVALGMMAMDASAFTDGPPPSWDDNTGGDWTQYDKARHLKNDATSNHEVMQTFVGPQWDFDVWDCDDILLGGAAQWYNTSTWVDENSVLRQGLVGINNLQGSVNLSGSITFHINNWLDEDDKK